MKSRLLWIVALSLSVVAPVFPSQAEEILLPDRPVKVGVDVVTALEQRRTTREYSPATLSLEDLSGILWAANGVNRPDGRRTAPAAHGRQYIDIYVVAEAGAYRYDAPGHKLVEIADRNIKSRMARQGHVAAASHVLVLTADMSKVPATGEDTKFHWAHSTAGTIAENVHLMAAARGIGTGIVAGIKVDEIRQGLNLGKDVLPLYVMPLGFLK